MDAAGALECFLTRALCAKRERILGFARAERTRPKFLELLYHQLAANLDRRHVVPGFHEATWRAPAYRFAPPKEFGVPCESLRAEHAKGRDAVLVIAVDGLSGFYREETFLDSEVLVLLPPATGRR